LHIVIHATDDEGALLAESSVVKFQCITKCD